MAATYHAGVLSAVLAVYVVGWMAFAWALVSDRRRLVALGKPPGDGVGPIIVMTLRWPMAFALMAIHGALTGADRVISAIRRRPPN